MPKIKEINSHRIVNSRGDWTIETHVILDDGSVGIQTVPDGASKGEREAHYLSVEKSLDIVSTVLNDLLKGEDPWDQENIDNLMIKMDGTSNKRHLGGNSILSVSLASAKAAAVSQGLELYEHLANLYGNKGIGKKRVKFPTPLFNILNGGKHAHNNLSFQEFMLIPAVNIPFDKAYEMGVNAYHLLKKSLEKGGYDVDVGDEGGFAPSGFTAEKAFEFIRNAVKDHYKVGTEVFFGADVAAESFFTHNKYLLPEEELKLSREELCDYHSKLLDKFEIIYYEDPFYENDKAGWEMFYEKMNKKLLITGDDLVATNPKILKHVVQQKLCNAVIVKPNQVGTLTETLDFIRIAQENRLSVIVSHRSGDTAEDTFIADLAIAVGADFIKSGAPARGERVAKYNRLLEIFNEL